MRPSRVCFAIDYILNHVSCGYVLAYLATTYFILERFWLVIETDDQVTLTCIADSGFVVNVSRAETFDVNQLQ